MKRRLPDSRVRKASCSSRLICGQNQVPRACFTNIETLVIPAKAGIHEHRAGPVPAHLCSWIPDQVRDDDPRSEEHTSELQSLMRSSYAVFCLKIKTIHRHST